MKHVLRDIVPSYTFVYALCSCDWKSEMCWNHDEAELAFLRHAAGEKTKAAARRRTSHPRKPRTLREAAGCACEEGCRTCRDGCCPCKRSCVCKGGSQGPCAVLT